MAHVVVLYNPLDTSRRRRLELSDGVALQAWLDRSEPAPGRCVRDVYLNGQKFDGAADYLTRPGDEVLVAFRPGDPATIGAYILQAVIAAVIGFALGRIFAPSRPKAANTPSPSQVYGIAPAKNAARLGEPIPVAYGDVILLPDYAAQPYVEYSGNEQFLRTILCLGEGEFAVHEMLLGDSSAAALPADVASFNIFSPAQHASTFGLIQALTGTRENVFTSADVSDQELLPPNSASNNTPSSWYWESSNYHTDSVPPLAPPSIPPVIDLRMAVDDAEKLALLPQNPALGTTVDALLFSYTLENPGADYYTLITYTARAYNPANDVPAGSLIPPPGGASIGVTKWIGPFEVCKAGQVGTSLELDFVFPGGLYVMDGSGNLGDRTVQLQVERTPINDAGAPTGAAVVTNESFTARANTAQRFTRKIAVTQGRYIVRVSRVTDGDGKASTSDRVNWTGLKFELVYTGTGPVYGNVTLAEVKLRASNGIASDAASSIRFRVTRKLPPPSGGALAPTANPADVFADIMTAAYGGNRPRNADELDLAELEAARIRWAGHNGFNAIFDQPSTVWEALSLSVQTVTAAPLPIGSRMTVIQDGVQPVRAQMFTDANIVAGSLQVNYAFDRDGTPAGVRVEFRDPRSFTAAAYLMPVGAPDYETVSLFGCTSEAVAAQHAQLLMNRRQLQRTTLTFLTELEGLSCLPGDRIGVQAGMPRWAQAARVVSVAGLVLELDAALVWTPGQAHAVQLRNPEGKPVKVAGVTQGPTAFHVVLPALPFTPATYASSMEPTIVSFGIDGQEITDWTVQTMRPQGDRVAIDAVNYDPAVWAGAAAHLLQPLPFDEDKR